MGNKNYCNQCENRCPIDDLKCGRGRRALGLEQDEHTDERLGDREHRHGNEHSARSHRKTLSGVLGLLQSCGHAIHHGEIGEDVLACFSNEEKIQLEKLLYKFLNNCNK